MMDEDRTGWPGAASCCVKRRESCDAGKMGRRADGKRESCDEAQRQVGYAVELMEMQKAHQKGDEAAVNDMSAGRQGQGH